MQQEEQTPKPEKKKKDLIETVQPAQELVEIVQEKKDNTKLLNESH